MHSSLAYIQCHPSTNCTTNRTCNRTHLAAFILVSTQYEKFEVRVVYSKM